jgi:hypothetical protein
MTDEQIPLPPSANQSPNSVPVYQPLQSPDAWIVTADTQQPPGTLPKGFWKWAGVSAGVLVVLGVVGRSVYMATTSIQTAVSTLEGRSKEMSALMEDQDKPEAGFGLAGKVEASYENPFDEQTSYTNPFEDNENPFDE